MHMFFECMPGTLKSMVSDCITRMPDCVQSMVEWCRPHSNTTAYQYHSQDLTEFKETLSNLFDLRGQELEGKDVGKAIDQKNVRLDEELNNVKKNIKLGYSPTANLNLEQWPAALAGILPQVIFLAVFATIKLPSDLSSEDTLLLKIMGGKVGIDLVLFLLSFQKKFTCCGMDCFPDIARNMMLPSRPVNIMPHEISRTEDALNELKSRPSQCNAVNLAMVRGATVNRVNYFFLPIPVPNEPYSVHVKKSVVDLVRNGLPLGVVIWALCNDKNPLFLLLAIPAYIISACAYDFRAYGSLEVNLIKEQADKIIALSKEKENLFSTV